MMIGHPVVYRAQQEHHTTTIVGKSETPRRDDKGEPIPGQFEDLTVDGSVHHPEVKEFAGQVTRVHPDGSHDLIIFPPNRPPVHVDRVQEGDDDEHGTFSFVGRSKRKKPDAEQAS